MACFVAIFSPLTLQAAPFMQQVSTTSFGANIAISTGTCELAHDTSILTNLSGLVCTTTSGAGRGHYKVYATPNTTVRIVVKPHNDSGDGVIFAPDGVIFSDSVADIAFIENATTNIDSGTSGIIDIYVGGVLTLISKQSTTTTTNFFYEIDFSEIP